MLSPWSPAPAPVLAMLVALPSLPPRLRRSPAEVEASLSPGLRRVRGFCDLGGFCRFTVGGLLVGVVGAVVGIIVVICGSAPGGASSSRRTVVAMGSAPSNRWAVPLVAQLHDERVEAELAAAEDQLRVQRGEVGRLA